MRVLILHDDVGPGAAPDQRDVLDQVAHVRAALLSLGHTAEVLPVTRDLRPLELRLAAAPPDLVFNLVESLGGEGRLIGVVPAHLERLGIPFTGPAAAAVEATSNKLLAKAILRQHDLPTPPAFSLAELEGGARVARGRYILKSVWEHGSLGLDAGSVIQASSAAELRAALQKRLDRLGGEGFAEAYVHGRELNVALLGGKAGGPEVLPAAEILFLDHAPDAVRLVGYDAKWAPGSLADAHTPRRFLRPTADPADGRLLARVESLARRAWAAFALRGHARVDFRVDEAGQPWVLEVNCNPCLSPGAGFAAALAEAGLGFDAAIARILADAGARP